jgi:hypothetical protein
LRSCCFTFAHAKSCSNGLFRHPPACNCGGGIERKEIFLDDPGRTLTGPISEINQQITSVPSGRTLGPHCFLLQALPDGFVKIRYFGFLAQRNRKKCIALIRQLIDPTAEPVQIQKETVCEMMLRLTGIDIALCPKCGMGKMKPGKPLTKTVTVRSWAPTWEAI